MAGQMKINYGSFDSWAQSIDAKNKSLLDDLHEIQRLINSLQGEWESNSAVTIRGKITGMENRFQQYHDVVDNYVKFIRNTAAEYKATETANDSNAQEFI